MKKKILIVIANYYVDISDGLLNNAKKILQEPFDLITVPGIFEIPITIAKNIKKYDGFVALGCVIKGETSHYHYLCHSVIYALTDLSSEISVLLSSESIFHKVDKGSSYREDYQSLIQQSLLGLDLISHRKIWN